MIKKVKIIHKNILFYLFIEIFIGIYFGFYSFLLGPFILSKGFNESFLGVVTVTQTISFALFAYIVGILSKYIKDKYIFASTGILCFISSIIYIFSNGKLSILFAASIYAMGISAIVVIKPPFLIKNSKGLDTVKLFSFIFIYATFMNLIGNFLSGKIIKLYNFNTALYIMSILSLLGSIPALFITSNKNTEKNVSKNNKLKINRKMKLILLYTFCGAFAVGMIIPYYTTYLINKMNYSTDTAAFVNNFNMLGNLLAMILSPIIAKRIGEFKTITFAKLLSFPFVLLFVLFNTKLNFITLILCIFFLIRSVLINITVPLENIIFMNSVNQEHQAKFNSIVVLIGNITVSISSYLAGNIISYTKLSYSLTFIISAVVFVIQALVFIEFNKIKEHQI
ncbi:MFS transporter [Thermobrachium celere]|uniref:Multidrug-efflux transporter n=1 Tax=Thermobrachium celere DSM 8682 TaxID=941824 RepID=R7RSA7_9CLOT|nr:MFS transporter [Thermobrachium celere]CDF59052.1 multidrug-efflux transporter [Thermobrachium celere DSM 8682]